MIEKIRVLKSVEHMPELNAFNVLWVDRIIEDGVTIAESNLRCAYCADDKERFLAEVPNADNYVKLVSW